jgi:hypothetical protein
MEELPACGFCTKLWSDWVTRTVALSFGYTLEPPGELLKTTGFQSYYQRFLCNESQVQHKHLPFKTSLLVSNIQPRLGTLTWEKV